MATKYKFVQNDTLPQVFLYLVDEASGKPLNLANSGTVVRMHFARAGTRALKETITLSKLPGTVSRIDEDTGAQTIKEGAPYEADGSGGRVAVEWSATALDEVGDFVGEIEVIYAGGGRMTDFDLLQFQVRKQIA